MKAPSRIGWVGAAVLAAGCIAGVPKLTVMSLNAPPRALPERRPESVELFTTRSPMRPYLEVALIEAKREWGTTETAPEIFGRMRVAAGKLGCDGLILLGEANTTIGTIWTLPGTEGPETRGDVETLEGYRATCFAWSEPVAPPDGGAPRD